MKDNIIMILFVSVISLFIAYAIKDSHDAHNKKVKQEAVLRGCFLQEIKTKECKYILYKKELEK